MKKVLLCAFESLPFIKTGGLGDYIYGLAKAIDKKEYELKVILPLHKQIKEKYGSKLTFIDDIEVNLSSINREAKVYSLRSENVDYLFIDNDEFFNREDVYGYSDDAYRFSFFNLAIINTLIKLKYYPDIIHSNDYHTALIPAICKLMYKDNKKVSKIRHIFTIHNLLYQGVYDKSLVKEIGFDYKDYTSGDLRNNDSFNFMKVGIVFADIVNTVSKSYSEEIITDEYGCGLETVLRYRKNDLYGILNGIDDKFFNPKTDKLIYSNYGVSSFEKGKAQNKSALLKELGLKDDKTMLIGVVSRMTSQKGMELILESCGDILRRNVKMVIMGQGESRYEYGFKIVEKTFKNKFKYIQGYEEGLAHKIYAACDLLLMPSMFEPCGLSQMIAQHYGTLPLVRETGGLKDSVDPYDEYARIGNGFSFKPYYRNDFMTVLNYAYRTYGENYKDYKMLIRNAMKKDVSFKTSVKQYEELYKKVLGKKYA